MTALPQYIDHEGIATNLGKARGPGRRDLRPLPEFIPAPPPPPDTTPVEDLHRAGQLVAECFDCGGRLTPTGPGHRSNGGLHLRADLDCTDCGRRFTLDITLRPHPRTGRREATR